MRWTWAIGSIFALGAAASAQTTQSSPAQLKLITQLSADDWHTRDAAQQALVDLGDQAVAALAATTQQSESEEARSRAAAALARIDENRLVGPSRITLHLHDASPQDAVAELARQSQTTLEPITPIFWQQVPKTLITIDLDAVPFWTAMDAINGQCNLWLQQWGTGLRIMNSGPTAVGPRCVSGPLLIVAESMEHHRTVSYGPNAAHSDQLTFHALVMAEPKLHVVRAPITLAVEEATDDQSNSLLSNTPTPQFGGAGQALVWNCNAELAMPHANAGTKLQTLRGTINLTLASRLQHVTLSLPQEKPTVYKSEGGTVTLTQATRLPNNRLECTLNIDLPAPIQPGQGNDWIQQLLRGNQFLLCDSNERPFARESSQTSGNGRHFTMVARFNALNSMNGERLGEPDHLSADIVLATKDFSYPFTFNDLALP